MESGRTQNLDKMITAKSGNKCGGFQKKL